MKKSCVRQLAAAAVILLAAAVLTAAERRIPLRTADRAAKPQFPASDGTPGGRSPMKSSLEEINEIYPTAGIA